MLKAVQTALLALSGKLTGKRKRKHDQVLDGTIEQENHKIRASIPVSALLHHQMSQQDPALNEMTEQNDQALVEIAEQQHHEARASIVATRMVAHVADSTTRLRQTSQNVQLAVVITHYNKTGHNESVDKIRELLKTSNADLSFSISRQDGTSLMLLLDRPCQLYKKIILDQCCKQICRQIETRYDVLTLRPNGDDTLAVLASSDVPGDKATWTYHVARSLLTRGCQLHARSLNGSTPLLRWASNPHSRDSACFGLLLLEHGADVNVTNDNEETMLHILVRRNYFLAISGMIQAGVLVDADLTHRDKNNETPMDIVHRLRDADPSKHNVSHHAIIELLSALQDLQQAVRQARQALLAQLLLPDLASIVNGYL